jgi:hypothetical protein
MSAFPFPQCRKGRKSVFCLTRFLDGPELMQKYYSVGEHSQKILEIYPFAIKLMGDKDEGVVYDGVIFFKAQGFSSVKDVLHITLSSIVGIEVEEGKEVFDFFGSEDRVFGYDVFCKNDCSLFFDDFLLVHSGHFLFI